MKSYCIIARVFHKSYLLLFPFLPSSCQTLSCQSLSCLLYRIRPYRIRLIVSALSCQALLYPALSCQALLYPPYRICLIVSGLIVSGLIASALSYPPYRIRPYRVRPYRVRPYCIRPSPRRMLIAKINPLSRAARAGRSAYCPLTSDLYFAFSHLPGEGRIDDLSRLGMSFDMLPLAVFSTTFLETRLY